MNPSPDDYDPADRLLDALLREQSRHRDADENLLDAIETALDARRPGATNRNAPGSARRGILLAFAAGIAMSAGGFFIWQQSRSSSSAPTLANNDEAPAMKMSTVPRQAKMRESGEPEILASRRMPEPEVMQPNDTLAQADTSSDVTATFEAPAAPAPAAALPPLARNALRSATPPAAAVAPVAGASEENTVPAEISEVRFLAWDDATAEMKIDVVDGDRATPIGNLHPLVRTGVYSVSASQPLKLRLEGRVAPADGVSVDQEVNLQGFAKSLVIVMPDAKASSGLAAVVINDDETNSRWGTYLIFNATSGDLALTMDKQATRIPVGWRPVLITPPPTMAGGVRAEIRTFKDPNKIVYSNVWPVDKDTRTMVVVLPGKDPRLGLLETKTIFDSKLMQQAGSEVASARLAHNGGEATGVAREAEKVAPASPSVPAKAAEDSMVLSGDAGKGGAAAKDLEVEAPPVEQAQVRFLAWDDATAKMAIDLVVGNQPTPIRGLHPLKRTFAYAVNGSQPLKLRIEGRNPPSDGTSVDLEVSLQGFEKPLVLLMPNEKAPSGLVAVVINDDESNFEWGSYLVFNATVGDIAMVVNKTASKIPAGWKPVLVVPPANSGPSLLIQLRTYKDPNKVVYSSLWTSDNDSRSLVVLMPSNDPHLGPILTKIIPESKQMQESEREMIESRARRGESGH